MAPFTGEGGGPAAQADVVNARPVSSTPRVLMALPTFFVGAAGGPRPLGVSSSEAPPSRGGRRCRRGRVGPSRDKPLSRPRVLPARRNGRHGPGPVRRKDVLSPGQ